MFNIIPYRGNHNIARRENRGYFEDFANDFFRPFFGEGFGLMPAQRSMKVDVRDEGDHYTLEADLPGVKKDDLKVSVQDGLLTISAEYDESNENKGDDDRYVYRERRCGSVSRAFNMEGIREDGITAAFKDGVLKLELPKCEPEPEKEAHAIEIQG